MEIIGTLGTIQWDYFGKVTRIYRANRGDWESIPLPVSFERDDLYRAQMRHFFKVCRHNERPICTLEDGVRALELALAVHKSQEIGARVGV
jgi:predicted dehydrogenase